MLCRIFISLGLLAVAAGAQTLSCSPSCAVAAGQTISINSTSATTFTLTGAGTCTNCGVAGRTSVTYTAPTGVVAQNKMLGCPVLPNAAIFNTPVSALPLDPASSTKIASMNTTPFSFQTAWGLSQANSSTPTYTFSPRYGLPVVNNFVRPAAGPALFRESGNQVGTLNNSNAQDHHILTVRTSDCSFWESYDDFLSGATTNTNCTYSSCNVTGAQTYVQGSYSAVTGNVTAGGTPLAPLTLHLDEILSGTIKHASEFTMSFDFWSGGYLWPATAVAGGTSSCSATTCVQLGNLILLNSGFSNSSVCNSSTAAVNNACNAVLNQWKTYGLMPVDSGTHNAIIVSADVTEDANVTAALNLIQAANITPSNFSVVDTSMLQRAAGSYEVCPNGSTCGFALYSHAANSYVTPLNQVYLTAGSTSISVGVLPVSVGYTLPVEFPVAAGSYTINLAPFFYVEPSGVSQSLNWSISSSTCTGGSINSSGVLTVPSSAASACLLVVEVQSVYDTAGISYLYLDVLPSASGAVRIDTGATAASTVGGNVWQADTGANGAGSAFTSDYPNWLTSNANALVYQSGVNNYGNDLRYTVGLPNGNYTIHLLYGLDYDGNFPIGTWPSSGYGPQYTWNPTIVDVQGTTVSHLYDWSQAIGYFVAQPADIYVYGTVSNNILQIGSALFAPDSGTSYNGPNFQPVGGGNKRNLLNGLEILPNTSAAFMSIDLAGNVSNHSLVAAGATSLPFYAVQNFFTGGTTSWSASGAACSQLTCTLAADTWGDGGETVTLSSGTVKAGQPITITATNGSYSATATLYTSGSGYYVQ